jgi:hypothetical protein
MKFTLSIACLKRIQLQVAEADSLRGGFVGILEKILQSEDIASCLSPSKQVGVCSQLPDRKIREYALRELANHFAYEAEEARRLKGALNRFLGDDS